MLTSKFNNYTINLVQTVDDFNFMKSRYNENVVVGLDTETSGLDYNKDDIAGYCISLGKSLSVKDYQGYYIPVRHIGYNDNLPLDIVVDFVQHLLDTGKVMFFNRPFDATMLEKDGITMPFVGKTHDVQIMAHLVTGESFPALKPSVKKYLKFDVIDFSENNAKDHNFKTTDPRVSYVYAANDPLITVLLGQRLWVDFPYIHKIYPIDNKASEAMRRFSNDTLLYLDKEIIMREHEKVISALAEVKNKIFSFVGYEFKLNSPRDKADALSRYVTLTQKTKGGQFEVGKEVLQKIDHPLAKMLLEYAKLEKYRGSYVAKMLDFPSDGFHINYSTCNVSCLTDANKVEILGKGLVPISAVKENDYILTRFGFRRVLWNRVYEDNTVRITLSDGSFIEGNRKHPVLLNGSWVGLGSLKLGDKIDVLSESYKTHNEAALPEFVQDNRARKVVSFDTRVDESISRLLGFIAGDGSLVSDGVKLCFSTFEPEVEEFYVREFSTRFNISVPARVVGKDNTVQYKFCSASLSRYLKSIGVKPHGDEVGLDISRWSTDCICAYIAGLFDTDGSVNRSGDNYNIRLGMTSRFVVSMCAQALRFLGISVHEFCTSYNRKQSLFSLRIRGRKSVEKFIEYVAPFMKCAHKVSRLKEYQATVAYRKSPWDKSQYKLKVVNIEDTGFNKVTDIEVEDCHEFIANGIVTHNTGRMSSGSSKGNEYFANFNIQNVPKTEVFRTVWRDDDLGYAINDRDSFFVEGDGEERDLYELVLEDGSVIRVDGDASVKIERNGKIQYSQVKNLTDTDILLES